MYFEQNSWCTGNVSASNFKEFYKLKEPGRLPFQQW